MEIPDPIAFASGRMGGNDPTVPSAGRRMVDPTPWVPLLRSMAMRPNSGGAMGATLADLLKQYTRRPTAPAAYFIDMNDMDETIARSL